jgi:hypothetical protein
MNGNFHPSLFSDKLFYKTTCYNPIKQKLCDNKNVEYVNKAIKYIVYKKTGQVIKNLDYDTLKINLKSIYDTYYPRPEIKGNEIEIFKKLNEITIYSIVKTIVANMEHQKLFLRDLYVGASNVMELPKNTSVTGTKQFIRSFPSLI